MATFVWTPFSSRPVVRSAVRPTASAANVSFSADESAESYTIKAVIPGINPDSLQIELANQTLTVAGESFSRSFRFGLPLNADNVQTSYEFGVLTITLPKADSLKPRRIAVQTTPTLPVEQPADESVEQPTA